MNMLKAALPIMLGWAISLGAHADEPAKPSASPYFGMHLHRADSGTRWPNAGVGSWRLWDAYTAWPNLQPERGRWDFVRLDRYVTMAKLTGVELLLPLGLSPQWASARPSEKSSYALGNAAEPRDMEDWRIYVRTVATRYKGRIRDFEIWNEPNEHGFFSGTPEKLLELTCEAYRVLKEVSPENRLVSPSMVGLARAPEQLGSFLEKGGKNCIDIVGFHFYVPKGPPEALLPLVERVRVAMRKAGVAQLPLWNTEAGWWIDGVELAKPDPEWLKRISVEQSGAWVARSLILGRAAGLERFYWYAWDSREMGLIDPVDGRYRPGAKAYATVARWLAGGTVPKCLAEGSRWICRMAQTVSTDVEELMVWDSGLKEDGKGGVRAEVFKLPTGVILVSAEDVEGRPISLGKFESVRELVISAAPIKLELRKQILQQ